MTAIYVDADACPVKEETFRVAGRHRLQVHVVANQWLRVPDDPLVAMVLVTGGFDAADDWIAERATVGDVVITADIPLADRCLKAGAEVLGPTGRPFTPSGIGMAMAMRDLSSHLRETGEIKGYNAAFTRKDRSAFLQALENAVQAAKRQGR